MTLIIFQLFIFFVSAKTSDLLDDDSFQPVLPNYCNDSTAVSKSGLIRANMGQFLGYKCSTEFFQCRWASDGFRTYRKHCRTGLVYDVLGTQNCNYDYNVKTCGIRDGGTTSCNATSFFCSQSQHCVPLSMRCDGRYDCLLEEDEQNCPMCFANEFACIVSEQCIDLNRRCNGITECNDGTDENNCDVCGNGLIHCAKSDECIANEKRCDGMRQCPNGEDELLCKRNPASRRFMCLSLGEYIPMTQVCDGIPQCGDGSDELHCDTGVAIGQFALPTRFFSLNSNREKRPELRGEETGNEEISANERNPLFPMFSITAPSVTSTTSISESPQTRQVYRISSLAKTAPPVSSGSANKVHLNAQSKTGLVNDDSIQFPTSVTRLPLMLNRSKDERLTPVKSTATVEDKFKRHMAASDNNGEKTVTSSA